MITLDYIFKTFNTKLNEFRVYPILDNYTLLFIRDIDNEHMIFETYEVELNTLKIVVSTVDITKLDLTDSEHLIFPKGRSPSQDLNVYKVLEYMRSYINSERLAFNNKLEFLDYIMNNLNTTEDGLISIIDEMITEIKKPRQYSKTLL